MVRPVKVWTPEKLAVVRRMHEEGRFLHEVAALFSCSNEAALSAGHRAGVRGWPQPTPWTPDVDARMIGLREEGKTLTQVALVLGMTRNAIASRLKRLGRSRPSKEITRLERAGRRRNPPRPPQPPKPPKPVKVAKTSKPEVVAPAPVHPIFPVVALSDLTLCMCRWPYGDPQAADFGFCGQPKREGSPYCPGHHAVAFIPLAPKRRFSTQGRRA